MKGILDQLFCSFSYFNFILNYLLLSDFTDWGCFWVQLSWQLGHTFGLPLWRDQDMGFFSASLTQHLSADVAHGYQRWLEKTVTGTGQLKVSSQTSHSCHPCTEILKAMPLQQEIVLSFLTVFQLCPKYHRDVPTARVVADQKWYMLEMSGILRKSSQMWAVWQYLG